MTVKIKQKGSLGSVAVSNFMNPFKRFDGEICSTICSGEMI